MDLWHDSYKHTFVSGRLTILGGWRYDGRIIKSKHSSVLSSFMTYHRVSKHSNTTVCPSSSGHCVVCTSSGHCVVCPSSSGHCVICPSSSGHCVVCPSSNYEFWLSLWYLQTLLGMAPVLHNRKCGRCYILAALINCAREVLPLLIGLESLPQKQRLRVWVSIV